MEKLDSGIRPKRRVRLLWLIDSLTMGGAERLVPVLAQYLDRERFELEVCSLKVIGGNPVAAELERSGVPVIVLGSRNLRDLGAFHRLARLIRDKEIDLIHTHLTYANIWGGLAGRLTARPVVSSFHVIPAHPYPSRWDYVREILTQWVGRKLSRKVIAVSDAMCSYYVNKARLPAKKMVTIHNGIDLNDFKLSPTFDREQKRTELGLPQEAPVIVTVAVLRPDKGHQFLFEAAPKILTRFPLARFLIVGDGSEKEGLMRLAAAKGLADRIVFTGERRDIPHLLGVSDVFILPSLHDAFPTTLLEAMAMKLPVVASRVGGIPEIVVSGSTGTLVPPGKPEALAEGVLDLLSHPEEARRMGERGRVRVEAEFSAPKWVGKLETLYREILRKRIYVIEFLGRGGMIHYAYQFCRGLAAQDVEVKLITAQDYELADLPHPFSVERLFRLWDPKPNDQTEWSNALADRGFRFFRRIWRGLKHYREWGRLIRYLRRERPDIVQFGEIRFPTDLIPLLLLRLSGLRLVDICHNVAPFDIRADSSSVVKTSPFYRLLYRWIYRCFETVFVHAEASRTEFLRLYGGNSHRICVIPHGNEELFLKSASPAAQNGALRKKLNLPEDAPVALFFGTLTKYKGVEYLLDAFAEVKRALPAAYLVVAGFPNSDMDVETLRRRAKELGIDESVVFHLKYVPKEQVAGFFNLADVAVFPYLTVSQSGALQLAYSFGKPVVATNVGGLAEVVRDGETGFLVPPRNPDALAEALTRLLRDRELARRLGHQARELSQSLYSWERVADQVREVYGRN